LDRADIAERREGLVVNVRRSKTDQEGAGRRVGVPYGSTPATCPVRALEAWCQAARIEEGPLFVTFDRRGRITPNRLHPSAVNRVVQRSVAATGVSPAGYSAHSLRAGLATAAAAAGVSERAIMVQTGHRSLTVARGYIREGSLFRENAAAAVGL
jgi:integrase